MLGIIIGVSRLSSNWLLSRLALVYIETFRNIPLLIQLLFWFLIILELPNVREGYIFFDAFYLNNSGFYLPWANTSRRILALGDLDRCRKHSRHRRLQHPQP